jgi:3-phosphoshikimate 1-carboxyvinyltransferase
MLVNPIHHPLSASVRVPGSKSLTNRALLIASLAAGTTTLINALFSDDTRYFATALQTLGFQVELSADRLEMKVTGLGGRIPVQTAELFIGNAGTAARFLLAYLTLGDGEYILDGEPRMRERPVGDLVHALKQLGANLKTKDNCLPVKIIASGLSSGKSKISGNISSQFLSALLMVAPYARNAIEIEVTTELSSKPYVDLTIAIMQDFGVKVERDGYNRFMIEPAPYQPQADYRIESDASAASYFFAAPAICGGSVRIENISRASRQGDIAFVDVLEQMGCIHTEENNSIQVTGPTNLRGIEVDMSDISDTAQTLAAIAPFASTPTHIHGISSARSKETDRVSATCTELARLGVSVDEHEDGMTIYPCEAFHPATIQSYDDHRMAMAFSLIGLRIPGVTIENPTCVSKTFPDFFDVLDTLR